jgi:hypothetical protein
LEPVGVGRDHGGNAISPSFAGAGVLHGERAIAQQRLDPRPPASRRDSGPEVPPGSQVAGQPPVHQPQIRASDYDCLNIKLKTYYARKRKLYEDSYPDFYDNDLRQLFAAASENPEHLKASHYLRRHRRSIMDSVCRWTNEKKYRVTLLNRLIERVTSFGLHVKG